MTTINFPLCALLVCLHNGLNSAGQLNQQSFPPAQAVTARQLHESCADLQFLAILLANCAVQATTKTTLFYRQFTKFAHGKRWKHDLRRVGRLELHKIKFTKCRNLERGAHLPSFADKPKPA